jgi:hypothetical protein
MLLKNLSLRSNIIISARTDGIFEFDKTTFTQLGASIGIIYKF